MHRPNITLEKALTTSFSSVNCRVYWICVLIASVIGMAVVFVYTLNDYLDDPVILNIDPIITKTSIAFPAVSVCIDGAHDYNPNNTISARIEHYIRQYYTNHNLLEPQG